MRYLALASMLWSHCAGPSLRAAVEPTLQDLAIEGWVLQPTEEHGKDRECAKYSMRAWDVSTDAGGLRITPSRFGQTTLSAGYVPSLLRAGIPTEWISVAKEFDDGWLVGVDRGEWGGALWWVSKGGASPAKLLDDNVRGIGFVDGRVHVATGLAHGDIERGAIHRAWRMTNGWHIERVRDLGAAPEVMYQESSAAILVLTTRELFRMSAGEEVERLLAIDLSDLYPTSLAVTADNSIFVGMRHFVVRLRPEGRGFGVEWLVPRDCIRFVQTTDDCVCVPQQE